MWNAVQADSPQERKDDGIGGCCVIFFVLMVGKNIKWSVDGPDDLMNAFSLYRACKIMHGVFYA
jgi:hypothetical protein